jgi:hypothetical protein
MTTTAMYRLHNAKLGEAVYVSATDDTFQGVWALPARDEDTGYFGIALGENENLLGFASTASILSFTLQLIGGALAHGKTEEWIAEALTKIADAIIALPEFRKKIRDHQEGARWN